METRRDFLKVSASGALGLGALSSASFAHAEESRPTAVPPAGTSPHFIFIRKGNGTFPNVMVPPSLDAAEKKKEEAKEALDLDLNKHELPDWMAPIAACKRNIAILQGLSAKMCTMGHSTYQSPLGVCRSAERVATISRATVDVELARLFPTPFEHVELTCSQNQRGVVRGMSAIGPMQPNYAFASPGAAIENLFQIASENKDVQTERRLDNSLHAFLSSNIRAKGSDLGPIEGTQKIGNYVNSVDALIERNKKVQAMADRIRKHTPRLDKKLLGDQYTTVEQQVAFAEIAVAALAAGLTNVITFTADDLGTVYSGLYEFDVHLHEVGHNKETKGVSALDVRRKVRTQHVNLIKMLVEGLKKTPEGKGTMFDNTIILYFPENGETHHSLGTEVPFLIVAGDNAKLNFLGRYIRLPNYNEPGHKTLGNFYTTLLNAYGNPIKHYGDFDVGLKIDQSGPIRGMFS
jgi:hypothetical protein